MMIKFIPIFFLLLIAPVFGSQYWVATTGGDGNSGIDSVNAFLTINQAFNNINSGDTIYVCSGRYTESYQSNGTGFYLIGRGAPGPIWSGGVECTNWTSIGNGVYTSPEVSRVNSNGVWYDTLTQLAPVSSSSACADADSSYYFDGSTLYIHLPANEDPNSHLIEVSTSAYSNLIRCGYCNLDGEKIFIRNFTFSLNNGIALDFSTGANSAPDSLVFDDVIFRNNSGSVTTYAVVLRLNFADGTLSSPAKYAAFNNCYFWANSQWGAGTGFIYSNFPGLTEFNDCYFGENRMTNSDCYFFNDPHYPTIEYLTHFNRSLFYHHTTTTTSHALISMSVKQNVFDSCLFVRNIMDVDGCITFMDCDSSQVTSSVFMADSARGNGSEGAVSATLSSVHPGDGHILAVHDTKIINCYSRLSPNNGSVGIYCLRGDSPSTQNIHWVDNMIVGSSEGNGLTFQDAGLVNVLFQSGNTFVNNNSGNYKYVHSSGGSGINPFGGLGSEYDTTLDSNSPVNTLMEETLLNNLNSIGNSFMDMKTHSENYWTASSLSENLV